MFVLKSRYITQITTYSDSKKFRGSEDAAIVKAGEGQSEVAGGRDWKVRKSQKAA